MPKAKSITLYACAIDYDNIFCFCPHPNCRQQLHYYRSNGDISNRKVRTQNHCYMAKSPERACIVITDATLRTSINFYRNGSYVFSKRKFKQTEINFLNDLYKKQKDENEDGQIKTVKIPIQVCFD